MVLHLVSHVLVFRVLINFIPFCYVFGPYGPIHIEVSTFNGLVLHLGWLSPSSSLTLGDFLRFYKACGFKPPWDYVALGLLEALYLLTHSSFMYIVIHLHSQLVMAIQSKFFDPTQKIPNLNSIFWLETKTNWPMTWPDLDNPWPDLLKKKIRWKYI